MKIVIISSSLNKKSRSLIMAEYAKKIMDSIEVECEIIDLKKYSLPFCDGSDAYYQPEVKQLNKHIKFSDALLIATPIYNYNANAVIKNVIELTGKAWTDKPVGFLCKAGGPKSYMSIIGLTNSLMLDFRCIIIPRFVYAESRSFDSDKNILTDSVIKKRIDELCQTLVKVATAFKVA